MFGLAFLLAVATLSSASAAVYYVAPAGSGTVCASDLPCSLSTALGRVRAGDTVIVDDGIYAGQVNINGASGTASAPITLMAKNRHKAIFAGTKLDGADPINLGFVITRQWWTIDGFLFRDYQSAIVAQSGSGNLEIRHNVIHDFTRDGIRVRASHYNYLHDNVVAISSQPSSASAYGGIRVLGGGSYNIIEGNIIYSVTNDTDISGSHLGTGITLWLGSRENVIRGNLVMDTLWWAVRIFSEDPNLPTDSNKITDNIAAFHQGGAFTVGDAAASYNTISNNVSYGSFFASWSAKGSNPGRNLFTHNTSYVTEFSVQGAMLADKITASLDSTVKDNLLYSNVANNGTQWLWHVTTPWSESVAESSHNLLWRPGLHASWTKGVVYSSTDIHDPAKRPIFKDEPGGDLSLETGSPGKNAASDGSDMGVSFNQYLRKDWLRSILALPTQLKLTNGATALSFTTSPKHQYQVFVYLPASNPYAGIETYKVEGQSLPRDLNFLMTNGPWGTRYVGAAPQRWVYIGTHANDGILSVSWTRSNAAEKVFIRQMPTVTEAYSWIEGVAAAPQVSIASPADGSTVKRALL